MPGTPGAAGAARHVVEAAGDAGIRIALGQPVERPPRAERAVRQGLAHPLDTPDLRRARPPCIGHDPVFGVLVAERDRLAALRKQVDQRRAAERQRLLADGALQFRQRAVQVDEDLQPVAGGHQGLGVHPRDVEEQELLRKGEVFGEQAEAGEAACRPGQQRLVGREADRLDRAGGHDDRRRVDRVVGIGDRDRVGAEQFVQRQRLVRRAAQEEAQPVDAELGEGDLGRGAFQGDAQHAGGAGGGRVGGRDDRQAGEADVLHLDRPQRDRRRGAVAQLLAAHRLGVDRDAGGQARRRHQIGLAVELHHHAGRHGRQVVRIEQAEQGVGQFGEFVVQPVMHAGGEERHAFEQAGDVRIVHRIGRQAQPAGDLRVGVGELGGQALDRVEFALVVGKQGVRHRELRTARLPAAMAGGGRRVPASSRGARVLRGRLRGRGDCRVRTGFTPHCRAAPRHRRWSGRPACRM